MLIRSFVGGEEIFIWALCQRAFACFPWFENMTDEAVRKRWEERIAYPNFQCLVAEFGGSIVGISWFHGIGSEQIVKRKSRALNDFIEINFPLLPKVLVDATVVDPIFQKMGIARALKSEVLSRIRSHYPDAILLTRMRDDNAGIIKLNSEAGFKRTGIREFVKGVYHEWWYLLCDGR